MKDRAVPDPAWPWLAPYATALHACEQLRAQGVDTASALTAVATTVDGAPRFIAPDGAPPREPYEAFIARTGTVPTRDNLHDFFNGLVWLRLPRTKRRLNELQAAEIARVGISPARGPLRDALTLFDESGAVLDAPPPLWAALRARDWHRLFVAERALWQQARLVIVGHALLEKLNTPRKAATAHVLLAPGATESIASDDAAIAGALDAAWLAGKPFTPLPVLGVPGWWPDNEHEGFYDDPGVFRPPPPTLNSSAPSPCNPPSAASACARR